MRALAAFRRSFRGIFPEGRAFIEALQISERQWQVEQHYARGASAQEDHRDRACNAINKVAFSYERDTVVHE